MNRTCLPSVVREGAYGVCCLLHRAWRHLDHVGWPVEKIKDNGSPTYSGFDRHMHLLRRGATGMVWDVLTSKGRYMDI